MSDPGILLSMWVHVCEFLDVSMLLLQVVLYLLLLPEVCGNDTDHCMHMEKGVCVCCYTHYSGDTCLDCPKCVQNYANGRCRKRCEGQTMHGEYCNKTCSIDCVDTKCDRLNGQCKKCNFGKYGQFCEWSCDCYGGPCDRNTGTCTGWKRCEHCVSKWCYMHIDRMYVCHGKCEGPYHGKDCTKPCPLCNRCDQGTGSCLPDPTSTTDVNNAALVIVAIWIMATSILIVTVLKVFKRLQNLRKLCQKGLAALWRKLGCLKTKKVSTTKENETMLNPDDIRRSVVSTSRATEAEHSSELYIGDDSARHDLEVSLGKTKPTT